MSKKKILAILTGTATVATAIAAYEAKKKADKTTYEANLIEPIKKRKRGIYEKYIKRALDVICATGAIVVFSPVYLGVAVLVKLKLGSPVLFTQDRPGLIGKDGRETVFKMYKFRTMTDERDENGELLPDEARLTKFGKWLRNTSLDELPEAFNILNGTMSVIGPRPQLVRDMVFMTDEQRLRHTAKPGLSGLAQVNGRNAISWEDKLEWDLKYIRNISLAEDIKIILATVKKAFIKQEGITQDDMATAEDFGDYLLRNGKIDTMNALAWWLNNASDRYILTFFCGTAINGIYAVSYKIPTILSTIQTIFYNAWSISAITEFDKDDRDGFIGNIYTIYSGISFIACSVIIMCNIFLARILYAKDFFDAWKFVPVLLTGTVFNGIALFEGCIFTAVKKTREVSNTTLVGAAINTVLNLLLIPFIGALGAAIATMVGYAIIWIVRTKRMLKIVAIKVNWSKQLTMMIALIVQSIVASSGKNFYIQVICMVVIIYKQKDIVKKIFNRLVKKESIK